MMKTERVCVTESMIKTKVCVCDRKYDEDKGGHAPVHGP